jgi:ribonuclease G
MAAMRECALPEPEHMARNTLVINCDIRETRVCLIENGVIAELHIERAAIRGSVGNIILGRVTRVLPGMQAAFIDIGMERAAFLHVEDLIRPDDFEAYLDKDEHRNLSGGRSDDVGGVAAEAAAAPDDEDDSAPDTVVEADLDAEDSAPDTADDEGASGDRGDATEANKSDFAELAAGGLDNSTIVDEVADVDIDDEGDDAELEPEIGGDDEDEDEDEDEPSAPATDVDKAESVATDSSPEATTPATLNVDESVAPLPPVAKAVPPADSRNGRRRRRNRSSRGRDKRESPARASMNSSGASRGASRDSGRDRRNRVSAARSSRTVPITEVVKEGDEVIVQVSKEPIGTKGARVTSHVALPGRHVVYLPTVDHVGISKRIGSMRERQRLRQVMESLKPEAGGLIVRTVAEGLTKKDLKTDIGYLIALWKEVSRRKQGAKAPATLYTELDLVLKTARDLFTDDVERIIIDDREQHARLRRFVEMFLPARVQDIELYSGDEPIFDAYGIEDEIGRALGRKVPLASGGYLVIDQAEALAAIDVNTGRYVGKGSKDLEETALKTNLEAVAEIAYQLRLRNIGGLVILDLIDMDQSSNREAVWRALEQALAKDKAKTTINRISELGLIEMTRKRTRESLTRMLHEPCFYCDGTGQIQSRATVAYEILRQIRRERHGLKGYSVVVNAHPAVIDLLQTEEKAAVAEAERRYMRRIELVARREYHLEQFDLQGR